MAFTDEDMAWFEDMIMQGKESEIDPKALQSFYATEGMGAGEAALIGAGRGLTTIGRAFGLADPETPAQREQFEAVEEQFPIATTVGEIGGQAAPFMIPGGAIGAIPSTAGRIGATGALGALEGGTIMRGEGKDIEQQLLGAGVGGLTAAALEAMLPKLGRVSGKIYRRLTGKSPESSLVKPDGTPTPVFAEALEKEGIDFDDVVDYVQAGDIDPKQAARKALLEAEGLDPTKAQITRSATDFQRQQEAAKTQNIVRDRLEEQERLLQEKFATAAVGTGGRVNTEGNTMIEGVMDKATALDDAITGLYKRAREVSPKDKNIKLNDLGNKLRSMMPMNQKGGGNIKGIVGVLQQKGVLNDKYQVVGKIDVETAEEIRQLMNQMHDPMNGFGNIQLRQLKEALDDDVFKTAGKDVFKDARKAKAEFEKELSRAKINKFDSYKKNLVRDMLENKIDPDRFVEKVVRGKSWRASDIKQMIDYLGPDHDAVKDLRAQVIDDIRERSFKGPDDAEGVQRISRAALESNIESIGWPKLKEIYGPEEIKFLQRMLKVTKLREPVSETAKGMGPSAQAVGAAAKGLIQQARIDGLWLAKIFDALTLDAYGRGAIRGGAEEIVETAPSGTRQALSQLGAAGAVGGLYD